MRTEQEIFDDLAKLCQSPGYVHALAFISFKDGMVGYAGEMTVEDVRPMFSKERLIRTELSTLIGLLIRADIDYSLPNPIVLQQYTDDTYALLEELHQLMLNEMTGGLDREQLIAKGREFFSRGAAMREPIFYAGESAYSFQYRDLSVQKYANDNGWLLLKKGFSIQNARDVVHAINKLQDKRLAALMYALKDMQPEDWTLLPGFSFSTSDVVSTSGLEEALVEKVLLAFAVRGGERNEGFRSLHDFNLAYATPLIQKDSSIFILFQQYSLVEALYETPFYWMGSDPTYVSTAMKHRGEFTEVFAKERLESVFGKTRVHANVDIYESKGKKAGEIDVFIVFGDQMISVPRIIKEIYICCVVSDHYPALSFQVRNFLKVQTTEKIHDPFVMDVFTLDAMAEMLQSPLQFLSYVNKRTGYSGRLMAGHELIILSYHLKRNLWLDDKYDLVGLEDDFSAELDVAMSVRRDGVPGKRTPEGILTRVVATTLGRIVSEIEYKADSKVIDLGFMLLTLAEHAYLRISEGIDRITSMARKDGKSHDCTVVLDECGTGLTIHCNTDPLRVAAQRLEMHCQKRKYAHKVDKWFGICVEPGDARLKFGLNLEYKWKQNTKMDIITRDLDVTHTDGKLRVAAKPKIKIGRNDPCPCGSGLKYKKCHLN